MTENPTGATGAENDDRSNNAEQPQPTAPQSHAAADAQTPGGQAPDAQTPGAESRGANAAYGPIPERPTSFPAGAASYGPNVAYGAPQAGTSPFAHPGQNAQHGQAPQNAQHGQHAQRPQQAQHTTPYPAYGSTPQRASDPYARTEAFGPAAFGQAGSAHHNNQGAAFGPAATGAVPPAQSSTSKRRPAAALLVATLAIGALIGGAAGAGAFALIDGSNGSSVASSSNGSQTVQINDTSDVTRTSAVAAKASPSVVTIAVQGDDGAGTGSGVILSKDGYVLTNNHVVTLDGKLSKPTIQVTANDGKLYSATVVGTDPVYDLAVIKLDDASGLQPIEMGDPSKLNVGDVAIAIGAPLGLAGTVTDGIVSALNRSITVASSAVPKDSGSDTDSNTDQPSNPFGFQLPGQEQGQTQAQSSISLAVIQTDASINPGNSGGALLDGDGKLIGINVAIASAGSGSSSDSQSGSIGVGFAIPADTAERIAKEIIDNGKATHGLLGASVTDSSSVSGSTVAGAFLRDISSGGAAEAAGLKSGDIVTNFNGHPITDANDLTAQVRALPANADAKVTYVRDGKSYDVDVTLGQLVL